MPAQTSPATVIFRSDTSTVPMVFILVDGDGEPVDLTLATVTIDIAYSSWSHYYSPQGRIVTEGPCVVDPDQVNNPGQVTYNPGPDDLTPPSTYHMALNVTYPNGVFQRVPTQNWVPMIIRERVGGP